MNTKEIFKDIPNYEGCYQVSNLGRVKSLKRLVKHPSGSLKVVNSRILKLINHGQGYMMVNLNRKNKSKTMKVHQLVAMAFLGHTPMGFNGLIIDHINGIKEDNRLKNLQRITQKENFAKRIIKSL
tara:strand:- start:325 stop:702 length:378 start_codon:yes stop_codon:yes gene_type:complete